MPPPPSQPEKANQPWPSYFLVRTTGQIVPLIALDELPAGVEIVGVPRALELEDTMGMLNLGLGKAGGKQYFVTVDKDLSIEVKGGNMKNEDIRTKGTDSPPPEVESNMSTQSRSTNDRGPRSSSPYHSHNNTNPDTHQTHQTQLCRHWCHHGICKWGQQCRYKHIMPMTLSGLHDIGLIDWPAWYRNLNPGYFSHSHPEPKNNMNNNNNNRVVRRTGPGAGYSGVSGAKIPGSGCCGGAHGEVKYIDSPGPGSGPLKPREKLRTGNKYVVRSRSSGRVLKAEELGDQIIARLRGMEKEKDRKGGTNANANALLERAANKATRGWEGESESEGEGVDDEGAEGGESSEGEMAEERKGKEVKEGKLVDV